MRKPYCPLSSAACNATIPTLPLSFVYKVSIGFLSRMRDWTVAVAQHSTVNLLVNVQYI
jgi:hypothetical protein